MKKFSHSIVTKLIVFAAAVLCVLGVIRSLVEVEIVNNGYFNSVTEDHYLESQAFIFENEEVIWPLTKLLNVYKNKEHILNGESISEEEWQRTEKDLFNQYRNEGKIDPELSDEENFARFQEQYADKIADARDKMIKEDLRNYNRLLQNLESFEGIYFYATDGTNVFTNTNMDKREQFEAYPAYLIFEGITPEVYPEKTIVYKDSFFTLREQLNQLDPENTVIYLAFSEEFLNQKAGEWKENKEIAIKNLYQLAGFTIGFLISFIYLVIVIGRNSFQDKELRFHAGEKIYNDISIVLAVVLITSYAALVDSLYTDIIKIIVPVMIPIVILSLYIILTLVKHIKNKTFFRHTFIYTLISKLVQFIGEVYRTGSAGTKTVLLVIGYPVLIALTFFIFPVTIGLAAWFALKKVKAFQAVQVGVEKIRAGDLHHRIEVEDKGEFKKLAENINSITDGLNKAVENELKSERFKTELITNVSHDIRTPLTSIITYVDLLKHETDPAKMKEYVEVLDQKSKRLKMLTDDLFEASKASSGNIPVQLEKIDIVSLINQGLGEVSDKIEAHDLNFRMDFPEEKVYLKADGKLLWRSIENLLSNIFKYALRGSRVYISIEDLGRECLIAFKNISACELNISPEELMERFKRGDESRTSQGSGLGLSIAKSLIEIQKGRFQIEIDGDLFKAMIYLPKYDSHE